MNRTWKALLAASLLAACGMVSAADPNLITIIVPYPAGGLSDVVARLTGIQLAKSMGVNVIIENRPGANGMIGLQAVARAPADGAIIGFVPASALNVNPTIYKDMKVDTVKDLTMLTLAVTLPNVLVVNPQVPARTMDELVAYLRTTKTKVSYGSMGTGSSGHLNAELLQQDIGTHVPHIPYKGSAPAMQDLVAGNIQMAFENLPIALPYIRAGRLVAIGVTSTTASPQAPDIPPIARSIPGFEDNIWFGFVGPAGMSPAMAAKLRKHLMRAIKSDEVTSNLKERGATTITSSPEEMRTLVVHDLDKWRTLIRTREIEVN